jgi:hypothetical protein
MKKTLIYGAIGGLLIYLYLRSKKSKGENTDYLTNPLATDEFGQPKVTDVSQFETPPANPKGKPDKVENSLPDKSKKPQKGGNNPNTSKPQRPWKPPVGKPVIDTPSFYDQRDFYTKPYVPTKPYLGSNNGDVGLQSGNMDTFVIDRGRPDTGKMGDLGDFSNPYNFK